MIYDAAEIVQLLVLIACFAGALVRALKVCTAAWVEITCLFACMVFGNVYYYGYMLVFNDYPHFSYISDLSWIAGYIFLLMLMVECDQRRGPVAPVRTAWIPVIVCAACCAFYIYGNGYPLLNFADNGLMAALGYFAVRGLVASSESGPGRRFASNKALHAAVLVFVIVEQGLWLSSMIPDAGPNYAVYTVFNYALTVSYAAILLCAWRSDEP